MKATCIIGSIISGEAVYGTAGPELGNRISYLALGHVRMHGCRAYMFTVVEQDSHLVSLNHYHIITYMIMGCLRGCP